MTEQPSMPSQITVNASAIPALAASNLRVILIAFGAYAVGKGWFTQDLWTQAVPILMILAPWVWGQIQGFITHTKLASVAADPRVPASVATLK